VHENPESLPRLLERAKSVGDLEQDPYVSHRSKSRSSPDELDCPDWLVVSLGATMAVVAGLVVSGLAGPRGPADLRVTVAEAGRPASGGRPFEVTVTNVGGTSAENVVVEVTVGDVTREVNLDLVAEGDTGSAATVVPADTAGPPHAEVMSYTNP
jgi:uncharacterized protein (TIGR02588 family)